MIHLLSLLLTCTRTILRQVFTLSQIRPSTQLIAVSHPLRSSLCIKTPLLTRLLPLWLEIQLICTQVQPISSKSNFLSWPQSMEVSLTQVLKQSFQSSAQLWSHPRFQLSQLTFSKEQIARLSWISLFSQSLTANAALARSHTSSTVTTLCQLMHQLLSQQLGLTCPSLLMQTEIFIKLSHQIQALWQATLLTSMLSTAALRFTLLKSLSTLFVGLHRLWQNQLIPDRWLTFKKLMSTTFQVKLLSLCQRSLIQTHHARSQASRSLTQVTF